MLRLGCRLPRLTCERRPRIWPRCFPRGNAFLGSELVDFQWHLEVNRSWGSGLPGFLIQPSLSGLAPACLLGLDNISSLAQGGILLFRKVSISRNPFGSGLSSVTIFRTSDFVQVTQRFFSRYSMPIRRFILEVSKVFVHTDSHVRIRRSLSCPFEGRRCQGFYHIVTEQR